LCGGVGLCRPLRLGCVVQADTTDGAIASAPDAIRAYLRYLRRHGENVDPNEKIAQMCRDADEVVSRVALLLDLLRAGNLVNRQDGWPRCLVLPVSYRSSVRYLA
jgi:hypothetical protein